MAQASQERIRDKIRKIDSELSILDQNDIEHQQESLKDRPFASDKIPTRISNCFPGEQNAASQPEPPSHDNL
jgi:hypothetical protein